jgi:murein DD-endopeptidase MepM/ murein hydrolase activator NlpD
MKKNTLYLILFLLISNSNFSQKKVFSSFKTLTTQAEVDEFGSHNYTHIDSWLRIEGDDITNLDALNSITNIKSSLWIQNNPNLENIDGLSKIDSIAVGQFSAQLKITNNPKLKNLEGLQGLIETSSIEIFSNENLVNIYGLRNVSLGLRKIHITGNDNLNSLFGLHNISKVSGAILITENKNLKTLKGLENLKSINSKFWIIENIALENLNALSNLEHTDGLWVTKNEKLNNFCGLTKLVNSTLPSSFTSTIGANLYNPSIDDIKNGNCSDSINFNLEYPKENDVYIVGRKIRLQFPSDVGIPTNNEINLSYSLDNGFSWVDEGTYVSDSNLGYLWNVPTVTQLRDKTLIKIETTFDGNTLSFTSPQITIQPVNYYESLGFKEDGVSELDFPLEGYKGSDRGWVDVKGSRGHFCLDNFAIDFNYLNYFDKKKDLTCGKTIVSPFNGKIISIYNGKSIDREDYDSKLLCGGTVDEKYQFAGLHVTIQSEENRNFAVIFAHLKNVSDKLSKGMEIKKGDFIGNVGGSGTEGAHLHMATYKNIYDWHPLININLLKFSTSLY